MLKAILSAVASFIIPGLGQLLNRKYKRGIVLILLWLVTGTIVSVIAISLFALIHLVFMISTGIDAYRIVRSSSGMT